MAKKKKKKNKIHFSIYRSFGTLFALIQLKANLHDSQHNILSGIFPSVLHHLH